jgi:hypothetical protein
MCVTHVLQKAVFYKAVRLIGVLDWRGLQSTL